MRSLRSMNLRQRTCPDRWSLMVTTPNFRPQYVVSISATIDLGASKPDGISRRLNARQMVLLEIPSSAARSAVPNFPL